MTAAHRRLADRIFTPGTSAEGRRADLVLEVLRAWGEPLRPSEIGELLDWRHWAVRQALDVLGADGRAGSLRGRWIADPPLAPTLAPPL